MFIPGRSRRSARALVLASLVVPGTLLAQEPTAPVQLSLPEAIGLAQQNNPELLQQRNDIDVARWSVRSAYGNLLPTASASTGFGYTASGERRFGSVALGRQPDYYSSSYSLSLNYQLSGTTLLQPSVERAQAFAVRKRVAGTEAQLTAQVSQQYLAALQAREQTQQAQREIARAAEYVRLAQARLEVGAGTPLDVRRAEVQQGRAAVSLVQARNAHATALLSLGRLLGVPLDTSATLISEFAVFDPDWQAEQLVALATESNPTLSAARASADAARSGVKAARSTYLPSLNVNVGLQGSVYQAGDIDPLFDDQVFQTRQRFESCQQGNAIAGLLGQTPGDCSEFDVGNPQVLTGIRSALEDEHSSFPFDFTRQPLQASLSISLPLFTGFSRQQQVEQAKATAADARYQVRAEQLRLEQEIGTALLNLEASYETALLQDQVRTTAEEELRLAQERFRFGAASSVEVTDAQTNLAQAERDQINAVYDFHQSLAALEALVGRPLR